MRVLFIYPSLDCPAGVNHGLVALSGVLKAAGHETKLVHVNEKVGAVPTTEDVLREIEAYRPGLVGWSVMSQQYPWSCEVAKAAKARFPQIPQIIGGVHCTMVPEDVTKDAIWDYVCPGEAEYPLLELVNRLERGEDTTTVPNMRIWNGGQPIVNPVAPFPNLQTMAPLDYDLFDVGHIVNVKKGWMGFLTSRGCPYKCTYCFNKEIVDLYMEDGAAKSPKEFLRHYPIERMIGEIRDLTTRFPQIQTLIFDDDLFTLNKKYVYEFCQAYKKAGFRFPFVVNAHVQVFDREMAGWLKDAGCMIVKYGLESGSPRVRKEILWRYMTNDVIERSFAAAHEFDLHTSAFVMLGLPTETRAEIEETLDLCARIKMGRYRWAIFFPFPGTAGYTIAQQLDLIDHDKAKRLGNYFDGSCLKFGDDHDLYIEKVGKLCNWYVNARTDWPSAPIYQKLVREIDAMDRATWNANKEKLVKYDRELSDELMSKDITHYAIRYTHVMGVRSDFMKWESQQLEKAKAAAARPNNYTLDD
jgi:radical SAM superfamily enzyme YgiQ (UPF0313 family)